MEGDKEMKKYNMKKEGDFYRITALRTFGKVKEGDIGGLIEREDNLSHEGDCWVFDNAIVKNNAKVTDNATVKNNAKITDNARVSGNASVSRYAWMSGNAVALDNARIFGSATASDYAEISGNAMLYEYSEIYGNAVATGNAKIYGNAVVSGNARVSNNDILWISNIGSDGGTLTICLDREGKLILHKGCFNYTLEKFKAGLTNTDDHLLYNKIVDHLCEEVIRRHKK